MRDVINIKCGFDGCKEYGHWEVNNRKESAELYKKYYPDKWKCTRHSQPEELLSMENKKIITTVVADKSKKYPDHTELYWNDCSGFIYGTGYKAFANDFPAGTKLVVTAEIILPD